MGAFLDTGYILALKNSSDVNHAAALSIYKDIKEKIHGDVYTSDYILDEAVTVALSRSCRLEIIQDIEAFIRRSKWINFIKVSDADINAAWKLFVRYFDKKLSFTDCTILTQAESRRVTKLCTFDAHFKGLIEIL
nr:PIN domain-containing protein [Candidatus Sigynarchaeota archaeon]